MSMYGMIFGRNKDSDVILATLGLTKADVGRFRDCFVADGKIAVYTRNGGGNRECFEQDEPGYDAATCHCTGCIITKWLPVHPNYLDDQDDDFDSTYATVYFSFPGEYADALRALDSGVAWDPDARWQTLLAGLRA